MSKKRIFDPAKATRLAFERREREAEVERLKASGAEVAVDPAGRIISARRSNVFNLFLARKTITQNQFDAAYELTKLWAAWKGLDGGPEPRGEFVNGSGALSPAETAFVGAKRQEEAGRRVLAVIERLTIKEGWLLCAFMTATVEEDRCMAWRGIVERETGLLPGLDTVNGKKIDRQAQAVVDALEALRCVYEAPRRAAA